MKISLLSPKIRLIFIIVSTSLTTLISNIDISVGVFLISLFILFLGEKIIFKKALIYVIIINTFYYFIGNYYFTYSTNEESIKSFIFPSGISVPLNTSIIGALKRNSSIILSFAWLSSLKSSIEVFESLNYSFIPQKYLIVFLKWLQLLYTEVYYVIQSIKLKIKNIHINILYKRIFGFQLLLKAIFNKFFIDIGKITFIGENHFNNLRKLDLENQGSIMISNLSLSYFDSQPPILKDVNIKVNKGDLVFLYGDNNSGKSTLLRAISGYIPKILGFISNGNISVGGINPNSEISLSEISNSVRFIIDNPKNTILGLTGRHELELQSNIIEDAMNYAKLFEIEEIIDRDPLTYSGGETVKLALAGILSSGVQIVLLDAPLCHLDITGQNVLAQKIAELNKSGVTVIITDYSPVLFESSISYYLYLKDSKLIKTQSFDLQSITTLKKLQTHNHKEELVIELKKVKYIVNGISILDNINLKVYKGQSVALLGFNGSGKSTLLNLVSRVFKHSSGILNTNSSIGMVFQDSNLQIIESTIYNELQLSLKSLSLSDLEKDNLIIKYCNWLELEPTTNTLELSSSSLKLLEIVCTVIASDTILLDEPTAYLSFSNIDRLCSFINQINKDKTILVATHNFEFASIFNRFIYLSNKNITLDTTDFKAISKIFNINNND